MTLRTLTQTPRIGQMWPLEPLLERADTATNLAQNCAQCQHKTLHGGCPMEVFDFDRGRYMCDAYLDSFTG